MTGDTWEAYQHERDELADAARDLGVALLPWQREAGERILRGEQVVVTAGRRSGRSMLRRVLERAFERREDGEGS